MIVIGAGVAGLATAALLAKEGHKVTVIEKNAQVGGRAGTIRDAGFSFDTGPSWYLMPEAYERFFELMGTSVAKELDLVKLSDPAYRVFPEGHEIVDIPGDPEAVRGVVEKLEPGADIEGYLADAKRTYDAALKHFLYTDFRSPVPVTPEMGWLALRSLDKHVKARFEHPVVRQLLTYPAVFLSSRPEKTPALYRLMSHTDMTQGVYYPRGGFTAVVQSLHRLCVSHGVQFRLNEAVTSIDAGCVTTERGRYATDVIVSAADMHHTVTELVGGTRAQGNPGVGAVTVMLGVKGTLPELAHHNLFFSRDWTPDFDAVFDTDDGWSRSLYVCKPSATDASVAPPGHENLFILVPAAAHPDFPRPDLVADEAIELVARRAGIPDLSERIVVRHLRGPADFARDFNSVSGTAIGPAHTLRQSAFLRGPIRSKLIDGLYHASSTTAPGVGVPLCFISAENAVRAIAKDGTAHAAHAAHPTSRRKKGQ